MNGSNLREASAKIASLASDAGWSGRLNCFSDTAYLIAHKTIEDWDALLQIGFTTDADGTSASLEISTPHVDSTSGPTQSRSGGVQVQASCAS